MRIRVYHGTAPQPASKMPVRERDTATIAREMSKGIGISYFAGLSRS